MVDAPALRADGVIPCGFESRSGHQIGEDMNTFSLELDEETLNNEERMEKVQQFLNNVADANIAAAQEFSKEKNVSLECALDVMYLRTRSRHTQRMEDELIRLHSIGQAPNLNGWPSSDSDLRDPPK